MKLNIIGIKRIKGDKSKAGNPYDICSIFGLVPIETSSTEKMQVTGKGYEIAEVPPNEGTVKRFEVKVKHDSGYAYLAVYAADMLAAIAFVMESEGCPLGELRSVVDIS